jgi:hypothetical protein
MTDGVLLEIKGRKFEICSRISYNNFQSDSFLKPSVLWDKWQVTSTLH